MKNIYLAGPMTGIEDLNFPKFFEKSKELADLGWNVFNPAQNDLNKWENIKNVKENANYRDCLYDDLSWITKEADAIAMLPGWENSKGAFAEWATAKALGLEILYL